MKTFVVLISGILLLACANQKEMSADAVAEASVAVPAVNVAAPSSDIYSNGAVKFIKTANYRFEVSNMDSSLAAIEEAMRRNNAFMASSDRKNDGWTVEGKMTIRVPADFFELLLKEIDKEAKVVNVRDVRTEDVAKQFVDLESRLKTKREVQQRYIEILRKKAGTIEELLSAERQIGELQEEIEATVSKLNYLKNEVRYSTINLELYERMKVLQANEEPTSLQKMREAIVSGWHGFVISLTTVLYLWPFIILAFGAYWLFRFNRKRQRVEV